jgi:hypothetical protein
VLLVGDIPSPLNPPSGCRFHTRCPAVMDRCRFDAPPLYPLEPGHQVRCLHAEGLSGEGAFQELEERIERQMAMNVATAAKAPVRSLTPGGRGSDRPARTEDPALPSPGRARLAARPLHRRALAALVEARLVLVVGAARSAQKKSAAARELDALVAEILELERVTQALPDSLDDLGWRLPPIVGGTRAVDPWGRALGYRVLGASTVKGARFEVTSLGPDGVPSPDDLVRGRK